MKEKVLIHSNGATTVNILLNKVLRKSNKKMKRIKFNLNPKKHASLYMSYHQ